VRCEEARSAFLQRVSAPAVEEHLATCLHCRELMPQLRGLRESLDDPLLWVEPPGDLEEKAIGAVEGSRSHHGPETSKRWLRYGVAAGVLVLAASALWSGLFAPGPDWEITVRAASMTVAEPATVAGWNDDLGTRVSFAAKGLEPAPAGFAYELWFSQGEEHVSAGTFLAADQPVALAVGVSRRDYPRVWVTLEPLDDDPGPSSVVVFDSGS
jgi:hypothetical protein